MAIEAAFLFLLPLTQTEQAIEAHRYCSSLFFSDV